MLGGKLRNGARRAVLRPMYRGTRRLYRIRGKSLRRAYFSRFSPMAGLDHDRNVLFGVLAWQAGLVERGALLEAMYDCTIGKCRDLPAALTARGMLGDADIRWLEDAMQRHVHGHADDAKRTLASLDEVDSLKKELEGAAGVDQMTTLAASNEIDPRAQTVAAQKTIDQQPELGFELGPKSAGQSDSSPVDSGSDRHARFRVVRSHARGGLGEVFVAVDTELRRDVALKQILPKQATNETSRARFLLEAEITGNLEHPGVVPVYALGSQADGCPYYAMRFIRGESLEDAIQSLHSEAHWDAGGEKALELRDVLGRFIAVCNTMEYAHSRGIIHRDIKPENIMLGRYGETLVVDWGLARPYRNIDSALDSEQELADLAGEPQVSQSTARPTVMGSVVGTPQFMSPEQALGRLDLMGPTSDVYSLGATLYALLTDQPPFTSPDVRRVLQDVQQGTFLAPRQVRPDVPAPLEAVCLKAMKLKPEDRYASARALAAEIERWLADEPVAAYGETLFERTQRWMRRHKTWTQAAAVAVMAVACVAATAYVREASLRADLQTALEHEATARSEAVAARKSAEANSQRAEQQSALALATLKTVLFDIQVRLKNLPATHSVRLSMLDKVVDGLQQVTRSLDTAPEADLSLVRAHLDIGDIYWNTGTGDGSGATQLAEEQYRRAMEMAEKLRTVPAQREQAEADLAAAYQRLGDVGMQRGQWTAGVEWLKKSLALREEIAARKPADLKARSDLAASIQRLGLVHLLQDELPEAEKLFARFLELSRSLQVADPQNAEYLRNLSVAEERMGDVALRKGDVKQAEPAFRESLKLRRRLIEDDPENAAAQRDLSVTLDRLADLARGRGEAEAADALLQESLTIRKQLYEADAANMQTLRDLSVSYAMLGDAALERNKTREAAEYFRFYLEMVERLTQSDPGNAQYQRDLAAAHDRVSQVGVRLGNWKAALASGRRRTEIWAALVDAEPTNADYLRELSTGYRELSEIELQVGELGAVRATSEEYLTLARKRAAANPGDETLARVVADACFRAATSAMELNDFESAKKLIDEAVKIAGGIALAAPRDAAASNNLANFEGVALELAWRARDISSATAAGRSLLGRLKTLRDAAEPSQRRAYEQWIKEAEERMAQLTKARDVVDSTTDSEMIKLPDETELLDFRASALMKKGDLPSARKVAEQMAAGSAKSGAALWVTSLRLASIYQTAPSAEREQDAKHCLAALTECYELGLFRALEGATRLEYGTQFRELLQRADFKTLLDKIHADTRPAETLRTGNATT
ncbi:MAG: hypothetical protein C0483_22945 [Pirellula sp.]|nr:hypothetical protein [Pirellula sp.]